MRGLSSGDTAACLGPTKVSGISLALYRGAWGDFLENIVSVSFKSLELSLFGPCDAVRRQSVLSLEITSTRHRRPIMLRFIYKNGKRSCDVSR
jgi:hypothetical protein